MIWIYDMYYNIDQVIKMSQDNLLSSLDDMYYNIDVVIKIGSNIDITFNERLKQLQALLIININQDDKKQLDELVFYI